jgi:hypothetical protein
LIRYNSLTREIGILNWGRYNFVRGGKPVLDLMTSELKRVKDSELVKWVFESYLGAADSVSDLNLAICRLFNDYLMAKENVDFSTEFEVSEDFVGMSDDSLNDTSHESSHDTYHEAGAISISITNKNNIKDLKDIVHVDEDGSGAVDKSKEFDESKAVKRSRLDEAEDLFNALWLIYPLKRGKGQIKNAQKLALLAHGKDKLIRAVERYVAYVQVQRQSGFNLQFQNGSTFFHSGYVDYLSDDYVVPAVSAGLGKSSVSGVLNNKFHNFEQSKQSLSNSELEAKLRGKVGGFGGSRASGE